MSAGKKKQRALADVLRVPQGPVDLSDYDPAATPGFPARGKKDVARLTSKLTADLSDLQERLFANGRSTPESAPSVLVVLQGMDTSGKGGTVRHAMGLVDPQGIALRSFKAPNAEERKHHYLWRIRRSLPQAGMIGVFDRSHYEDVLVVRVESLVPEDVWSRRYDEINRFEEKVAAGGTTIVKCMLNVSFTEQKKRLAQRLSDPSKYWKYNPADVDAREQWPAYRRAYEVALERCNTEIAPWYVIPADRKWYRNWAVAQLLREKLAGLNLQWPAAEFDIDLERRRVAEG